MADRISSLILIGTLLIVFSYYGFLELATTTTPTGDSVKLLTNSTTMFVLGVILIIIAIYLFSKELFRKHNAKTIEALSKVVKKPSAKTEAYKKVKRKQKKKVKPKKKATKRTRRRRK